MIYGKLLFASLRVWLEQAICLYIAMCQCTCDVIVLSCSELFQFPRERVPSDGSKDYVDIMNSYFHTPFTIVTKRNENLVLPENINVDSSGTRMKTVCIFPLAVPVKVTDRQPCQPLAGKKKIAKIIETKQQQ